MSTTTFRSKGFKAAIAVAGGLMLAGSSMGLASAETDQEATHRAMAEACGDGYLCVWPEANGHGEMVKYFECGVDDTPWPVGSWINNQYTGQVAGFIGPDPANPEAPWIVQYTSTAPEFSDNNRGFDTRQVHPC
ncbi:peptidase inhibitor family I36 protein [Saccharopolyspora dendranthemae]|uniref:Peptidase inhibitor family I36 n=1 Tax=Saccharopolyspora dendranthemae TaxID=1181886 RepID=A0A561U9Q9_9PSEU|nr:peptidase inhibitor family I36 protein [Saccharopolyspora dendranthemae]TWF96100.1 peptidase inhibitor family I36 [Saccharopolyspora dendranthemae]